MNFNWITKMLGGRQEVLKMVPVLLRNLAVEEIERELPEWLTSKYLSDSQFAAVAEAVEREGQARRMVLDRRVAAKAAQMLGAAPQNGNRKS